MVVGRPALALIPFFNPVNIYEWRYMKLVTLQQYTLIIIDKVFKKTLKDMDATDSQA